MTVPAPIRRFLEGRSTSRALGRASRFYLARREQITYLMVGGWNTLFGYCVWAVMEYLLHPYINYLIIIILSWPIAVTNAYLGYRFIVFRSHGVWWKELPRFSLVYVATLASTLVALPILLHVLPFSIYVTQACFTVVVVVASYLGHKYFSFRGGRGGSVAHRAKSQTD
jgi:putative flippase GtrA